MNINIPTEVQRILDLLSIKGYEAYVVGGCVRDSLLGRIPQDWDITTNAKPHEVIDIFKNYKLVTVGLKHGTIAVIINNISYEITTYRIDGEYTDNRRPESVVFTKDIAMDLSRRDFTINAMAYNHNNGLIDLFNGNRDLSRGIIRTVGDPNKRFNEDALRMLRAIRFSSQLSFIIEDRTKLSIIKNVSLLNSVSAERIREEFNKILLSDIPSRGIRELVNTGLIDYIIPEIKNTIGFGQKSPYHDKDVYGHILSVVDNTSCDLVLRLAALLHDIAKPKCFTIDKNNVGHFHNHHRVGVEMVESILGNLKYDLTTIDNVKKLVKDHMTRFNCTTSKSLKGLVNRIGVHNIDRLIELCTADIKGGKPPHDLSSIIKIKELWNEILNEKHPLTIKDLHINGYDLIKLGVNEGKEIGAILNILLDMVLEDPELNKNKILISEALKIIRP